LPACEDSRLRTRVPTDRQLPPERPTRCCQVWAWRNREPLSRADSPAVHANAQKNCRPRSSANLNLPANRVEHVVDGDFQNGSSGLVASFVGGHRVRTTQNDVDGRSVATAVAHSIGAISRRVCWTKDGDGRRSQSGGQMQRPGITTDDADGVAQNSHELAE